MSRSFLLAAGLVASVTLLAHAQTTFQLDPQKGWTPQQQAATDPERAPLDQARRLIAEGKFTPAKDSLTRWIDAHESSDSPLLPEAYLLRGNARLGEGHEYKALFDYEKIANKYAESDSFAPALERELDVAILYLNGLRKPSLGMRIDSGVDVAEEIILRIHERLPFSRLDERAELELADFYYRDRDLKMAATAYDCFLANFPKSDKREHALQRRAFATIAQFKGPRYDASGLVEAKYQVKEYQQEFPVQAQRNGLGDALTARLDESTAAQKLEVAHWYLRHADLPGARLTLSRLVHQHPATAAAYQALALMDKHGWVVPVQNASPKTGPEPEPVHMEKGQ
jgi:outer membrane protein assembly factor BamD (BamD/ComL family)